MLKRFKSVSMVLCLLGSASSIAWANPHMDIKGISITQNNETCKGTVKDATGETVIGASIVVKGTTNGTITDFDGNFELTNVKVGDIIQISYVGFSTKEIKWDGKPMDVVLKEDTELLEEVVVVGYGVKQKRSTMTTSISKVDNKALENVATSNPATALQGSVSGLRVTSTGGKPGEAPTVMLRGGAGLKSASSPLVVVDGIVRSMDDIDPADIESMQVLKDAASTAIYGARASSGVILITTKKGKEGAVQISYKFKGGINFARKGPEWASTEDYLYYNRLGVTYSYPNEPLSKVDGNRGYGCNPQQGISLQYLTPDNKHLLNEGWLSMKDPVSDKTLIYQDFHGQMRDATFKNSTFTQDHHLSMSGGNEKGAFASSLGYYDEEGVVVGTKYRRFNGSVNGNYKVLPFLNVKAGATLSLSEAPELYMGEYELFYRTQATWPTFNPWNEDGSPNSGYKWTDGGNPQYWKDIFTNRNTTRKTSFNIGFDVEILKDKLYLKENSSLFYTDYTAEKFTKEYHSYWANSTTRESSAKYQRNTQHQHSLQLEYTDSYADKHNLSAMVGGEYFEFQRLEISGTADGSSFDQIPTMNMASKQNMTSYSYREGYRIASGFARVTYDYNRKYLFTAVARYDGISRLDNNRWGFFPGVSGGWNIHEEDFFKDSKLAGIVSTLKPRISYGINGNVNGIGNYEAYGRYGTTNPYQGQTGIANTIVINRDLKWEKSKSLELGLDLGLDHNRYNFVFSYYNRTTSDLLTDVALPGYTGFGSFKTNLGSIRNRGFEVEADFGLIRNPKGFNLSLSMNASYVSNKVVKLPYNGLDRNRQNGTQIWDPKKNEAVWVTPYDNKSFMEGETLGNIYAYKQVRILRDQADVAASAGNRIDEVAGLYGPNVSQEDRERYNLTRPIEEGDVLWEDVNGDGHINSLDRVKVGNIYPDWTGGFSTTMSYKDVSLYARFDYALGHTIYNDLKARTLGQYQGAMSMLDDVKDTWTPENRDSKYPKFYFADQQNKRNIARDNINGGGYVLNGQNSAFYEKGDYLACREVTLTYKLPKAWISKLHMTGASVYVTGQNLFYITGYTGSFPEPAITGWNERWGVDAGRYPTPRTVLFGASVTF